MATNKKFLQNLQGSFVEIIRKTSSDLPRDVRKAIEVQTQVEDEGSRARYAMDIIQQNIALARVKSQPICQDTGSILFFIHYPAKVDAHAIEKAAIAAVKQATKLGYLRQNSVDSIIGKNSGNNVGPGFPSLHMEPWSKDAFDIRLVLKGGGCENVGAQYSLPDTRLQAGRDLAGVRKCILDALIQAQGKGCGPGILGVVVGGDRATGYLGSKEQLLRKLDDKNKDARLAELEKRIVIEANELGVGPMGFGGKTTLLGCKIGALNRVPASYFVSISYMCWAYRRQGAVLSPKAEIKKWIY